MRGCVALLAVLASVLSTVLQNHLGLRGGSVNDGLEDARDWARYFGQPKLPVGFENNQTMFRNICVRAAALHGKDDIYARRLYLFGQAGMNNVHKHIQDFSFDALPSLHSSNDIHDCIILNLAKMLAIEHEYCKPGLRKLTQNQKISPNPPIFIMGFPGSGTSLLQWLISLDPASRALLNWEALYAVSPGTDEEKVAKARRYDRAAPRVQKADWPDECSLVLEYALSPSIFQKIDPDVPGRAELIEWATTKAAADSTYAFHRRFVQILYRRSGNSLPKSHWVFKDPVHLANLDSLFKAYPDARIIWTHRNLQDGTLCEAGRALAMQMPDVGGHVRDLLYVAAKDMNAALDVRDAHPAQSQFCDVYFEDLIADPINTVSSIYKQFGMKVSDEHHAAMRDWLDRNFRQPKKHNLTLQDLGIPSSTALALGFLRYVNRFPRVSPSKTRFVIIE